MVQLFIGKVKKRKKEKKSSNYKKSEVLKVAPLIIAIVD
jgi:hypothetical protein